MELNLNLPSPYTEVNYELFERYNVKVLIKRDDLIHPEISGNKWRKLKLNIEKYKANKYEAILSFGGAYSNHISALAAVGDSLNISTIGIIRGDELNAESNDTLRRANDLGMKLVFVSREEYSWRYEMDYKQSLRRQYGNVLVVEEGGANYLGVMGCTEIVAEVNQPVDYYVLPAGTGTTTAGVLLAAEDAKVISVPVFKNGGFIKEEVETLLTYAGLGAEELAEKMDQLSLATEFSFGGYGKFNEELIDFINEIYSKTKIPLDQIYTGKAFYALCEQIRNRSIPKGSTVLFIHTGGLQGTRSIKEQLIFS